MFEVLESGFELVRIFDTSSYSTTATSFRYYGPLHRFDHHSASEAIGSSAGPRHTPVLDPDRGVYYAARTLSSCLVELFGDDRLIEPGGLQVAVPVVRRDLRLLDLRSSGAMRAGTAVAVSKARDRALTQMWSRHFYEATDVYGEVDGLIYAGAHNGEDAICLYARAVESLECAVDRVIGLDDPLLRPTILEAAADNDLWVP